LTIDIGFSVGSVDSRTTNSFKWDRGSSQTDESQESSSSGVFESFSKGGSSSAQYKSESFNKENAGFYGSLNVST